MSFLSVLGMLGAGAMSSASQVHINEKNLQNQLKTNAWSQQLSDSAHQREVVDLYKAGLNPILSASGAGSSVPTLGTPNLQNPGQGLADGLSSASNLLSSQYKANVANLRANTEKTNADTSAVKVHSDLVAQQRENEAIKADILRNERGSSLDKHFTAKLEQMAISEAITGRRRTTAIDSIDWDDKGAVKAYNDLVQKYRNQIELERYMNSVERQKILDSVNTAGSLKSLKSSKTVIHEHRKGKR